MTGAVSLSGPVGEFCVGLRRLRETSGVSMTTAARRLNVSRQHLYAVLGGQVKRPPDWDKVVRPLVEVCTGGDQTAVAQWRARHELLVQVWEELRRQYRAHPVAVAVSSGEAGSGQVTPRQLPAAVGCFTGRQAELAALTSMLEADPGAEPPAMVIPAISGTAGVGKTAVAVQWAHQVAERFPDGQLYVNLRGYDPAEPVSPADALASLLRALGVPGADIPDGAEDRSGLYRSRLAGRRVLVLLDNARDSDQVRPLLPGDPGCAAVVTSRDALGGLVAAEGARRLDLDVLPLADAVALLRSLIGGRAYDDPAATAALAGLCARLPLALRIAAERAAARRGAPLAELVAELADTRLDCLDAGDDRADVRAVLSWSCRQLPSGAALVFALMGLHPGADLDVHGVAALAGSTPEQARRALGQLHRASLIQASLIQASRPGRYGMLDLIRAYAREQAVAHNADDQALTRLFDYYLATATAAMDLLFPAEAHWRPRIAPGSVVSPALPDEDAARAWLDQERANLVAVITYCAGHRRPRHATGLSATLYRYLINGSYLPEADTIYAHALRAARESGDPAAEASALNSLGGISVSKGRFRDAAGHYRAALERYRRCGDRAGEARALNNIGWAEQHLNNHRSAAGYYRQAIAVAEDAGDRLGGATALTSLGDAEIELGSLDQASEHLRLALAVFREEKDQTREAEALTCIGAVSLRRGEPAEAAAFYEQALAIFRCIDQPAGIAFGLTKLGEVGLRQGDYQQAIAYLRQALALYQQAGDQHGEILALRTLAETLQAAGQPAAARLRLTAALRLAAETGNTYQQASVHRDLAESHRGDGQDEQARHHWEQAITWYAQIGAAEADQLRSGLVQPRETRGTGV